MQKLLMKVQKTRKERRRPEFLLGSERTTCAHPALQLFGLKGLRASWVSLRGPSLNSLDGGGLDDGRAAN
jgi:hypothetical protein